MNRILIVEDEQELRDLISYNLEREGGSLPTGVSNANDALIVLGDVKVDLILLDIMLPGLSGLDFLKIIKNNEQYVDIPVIIISAKSDEQDILEGLKLGADDYLTKPFSIKILQAKIKTVLRRASPGSKETLVYKSIKLNTDNFKVYCSDNELKLTRKEFELLQFLMKSPGRAFHRNQLLNSIWGYDSELYTRTVDAHVSSLRKKLGKCGEMIKSIPKVGYGLDV